jgi:hypothetical protein
VQARGVDEHSIADVIEHKPGSVAIKAGPSGSLHLRRLEMKDGRMSLEYEGEPPIIEFTASRPKLIPVTNRGRKYQPPTSHSGASVDPENVVAVAELGLKFYEKFVAEAEAYFVK